MKSSRELFSGKIIDIVNEQSGLDIKKKTRRREYVEARALCYTLLREHLNTPYWVIGHAFGLTHASVLHATNEFPFMMKFNPKLKDMYFDIKSEVQNIEKKLSPKEKREYHLMDEVIRLKEENRSLKVRLSELKRKLK